MFYILLIKGNAIFCDLLLHTVNIKQMKLICPVLITGDRNIVQRSFYNMITKLHGIAFVPLCQPAIFLNPWIRIFLLQILLKYLLKKSQVIVDTNAVSRNPKSRNRIQETRCQTSQSTISQRWLRLNLLNLINTFSILLQFLFHRIKKTQIDQIIGQ